MNQYSNVLKRAMALLLTFVMAVSVVTVTPATTAEAASKKVVKKLSGVSATKTLKVGQSATIKAKVTATKKVAKGDLQVSVKSSNKKVVAVKVSKKPTKKAKTGTTQIKITGKKAGTATVTVTTKATNKKNKKVVKKMKVTVAGEDEVLPTAVTATIDKSTINVGEATVITPTVLPANAKNKNVTYSSSNEKVATVSANGVVTGIHAGKAAITVKTSNGKTTTVDVNVVNVEITSISLDRNDIELTISGTTTLTATIEPANATDKAITWKSSDASVADVKDGIVTGKAAGTATITATSSNGLTANCTVKVVSSAQLADGLSVEMVNPYQDADGNVYENTALVGNDMTIRTQVVKNGQPVGNTSVTLTVDSLYGNLDNAFTVRNETVTTDDKGFANFAIGLKSEYNKCNAVSGYYQSLIVTAKESGANVDTSITVKFASVDLKGITVLNNDLAYDYADIVPSDNASDKDTGVKQTGAINMVRNNEYVSSQQVSSSEDDHKVYLSATPELILPATAENAHVGSWEYKVAEKEGTSGPCSVYNDETNKTTTVEVYDIPAGLANINLSFDKISLSKYTTLNVDLYDAVTGESLDHVQKKQESNGSNSVQVKKQKDKTAYLVVSLISQGQVDTTSTGYVLTKLSGVWVTENNMLTTVEEIKGSVKWENVSDTVRYENFSMDYDQAEEYLPADSQFLNKAYSYIYKIPTFPNTGNAIIVVKDKNENELANYLYPVVNDGKNVNVLADSSETIKAVLATNEEVNNKVGTLSKDGNIAVLDSTKSGFTAVKATINVAGLKKAELNEANGKELYTYVQWAPVPEIEEEKVYPDYFAIEGQTVTVTAKLYDKNGNEKTTPGEKIDFYVNDEKIDAKAGGNLGAHATITALSNNGSTDAEGTVTMQLQDVSNNDLYSMVEALSAKATGYNVKLSVAGDEKYVDAIDVYWVDLGLTFVDSADETDNPARTTQFDNKALAIEKPANYTVSDKNGWTIGYQVVARSPQFKNPYYNPANFTQVNQTVTEKDEFISVSGVDISYSVDDGIRDIEKTDIAGKNAVTLNTTESGTSVLSGTITVKDPAKVTFTFYNQDGKKVTYKNVGTGNYTAASTSLELTTVWNQDGREVTLIAPKDVNENEAVTVYVLVTDKYGNKSANVNVKYSVSGVNETKETEAPKTDSKGVSRIELPAPKDISKTSSVVYVQVEDSVQKTVTINYIEDPDKEFTLLADDEENAKYTVEVGKDLQTLTVYFTNAINTDSLKADQFVFAQNADTTYSVVSVEKGKLESSVVIKLDKKIANADANHTLTIKTAEDKSTGVIYKLMDKYGQSCTDAQNTFVPKDRTK